MDNFKVGDLVRYFLGPSNDKPIYGIITEIFTNKIDYSFPYQNPDKYEKIMTIYWSYLRRKTIEPLKNDYIEVIK